MSVREHHPRLRNNEMLSSYLNSLSAVTYFQRKLFQVFLWGLEGLALQEGLFSRPFQCTLGDPDVPGAHPYPAVLELLQ